jgi:hypothetical protein
LAPFLSSQREIRYLIKLLIKLAELSHLLHDFLPHEERCVEWREAFLTQDTKCKTYQRLLKENCCTLKKENRIYKLFSLRTDGAVTKDWKQKLPNNLRLLK